MKCCEVCKTEEAKYCFDALVKENLISIKACVECGRTLLDSYEQDYWTFEAI